MRSTVKASPLRTSAMEEMNRLTAAYFSGMTMLSIILCFPPLSTR
jgi:hypothetical protein